MLILSRCHLREHISLLLELEARQVKQSAKALLAPPVNPPYRRHPTSSLSLLDGDLFDEAMDGGPVNINGQREGSPELFDLSRLGESLAAPSPRKCRTPEAFLGPTGASLVNLDTLIPANPPAKTGNPFLSGMEHLTGGKHLVT